MQLIKSFLLATTMLGFASAIAVPDPVADAIVDIDSTSFNPNYVETGLEKRACDPNGCRCFKGKAGKYCGKNNNAVELLGKGGKKDHIYQCDGSGTKKGCCDYGYAKKCKL